MIDDPLGCAIEQSRRRMQEDRCSFYQCLVPFLRILLGCVPKVARADCPSDAVVVIPARDNIVLIPIHDAQQLLPNVRSVLHGSTLDKIVVRPRVGELACLPGVVHREEGQVVAFGLVELGLLRVRLRLLVPRAIEDILCRQHRYDSQDLLGASQINRCNEHFGHRRVHWEVCHLPP